MASKEKENYGKNESLYETTSKQTPNGAVAPPTVEGNLGNLENISGERNSLRYNIRDSLIKHGTFLRRDGNW